MNTRRKAAGTAGANAGAKPPAKAPAPKPAPKRAGNARSKQMEPQPEEPSLPPPSAGTSNARGRKRKQQTPPPAEDVVPESLPNAQFQAWLALQAAEKLKSEAARQKAAKAAKDKSIQSLNAQLLAAEANPEAAEGDVSEHGSDDGGDNLAGPRKRAKVSASLLDEDEQEAANELGGELIDIDDTDDDDPRRPGDDDGNDGVFEEEVIRVSPVKKPSAPIKIDEEEDEEEDDDDEEGDEFDTNGLNIVKESLKPASLSRRSRGGSRAPSPALSVRGTNKVTRNDFESEAIRALADAAKSMVRMKILYGNWDTNHSGRSGSQQWAAETLQTVAQEQPHMLKALKTAFRNDTTKEDLLTYILYGKGALFNTFISKARLIVVSSYGLTGRQDAISSKVAWLLKKTQFTYGGIDIEAKTFEKTKVWGNSMIKELLQLAIFGQGGKADARTVQEIRKNKAIPISAIILSITATEHAIAEYRDGTCHQYPFKEQSIRKRYTYFEKSWDTLEALSQKWATFYIQGIFTAISAAIGLSDWVDSDSDDDGDRITAMDLDNIAETSSTPF